MIKALYTYTLHIMYCGQYPQTQIQVKCLAQGHNGFTDGGFRTGVPQRPLDLMINAQPTAPLRPIFTPRSHQGALQVYITHISYM